MSRHVCLSISVAIWPRTGFPYRTETDGLCHTVMVIDTGNGDTDYPLIWKISKNGYEPFFMF